MTSDILFQSAADQAGMIAQRAISASELLEEHLAQIQRCNPEINAIVTLDEEGARRRAREADAALARGEVWGPLHGIPMTVKDVYETAEMRTTSGFPPLSDYIPERDAVGVARLKAAGAIIIGKTNSPVLAMDGQTNNPIFGPTRNPWNPAYNVGGSSGGAAAALAAGMTPLEYGSDIAGSLRLPAHSCGVLGFKPTELRVPGSGHIPPPPGTPPMELSMACFGPLARTIDDLVLGLRVLAGPDPRQWEVPPVPLGPLPEVGLKGLRLAWAGQFGQYPPTRDTRAALARLAGGLEQAGCIVEPANLEGIDFAGVYQLWVGLVAAMGPDFDRITLSQYAGMKAERYRLTQVVNRMLEPYDALVCPVAMRPAFQHCPPGTPLDVDGQPVDYEPAQIWYTCLFNITGHPAVSLPLGLSSEGLPIGVQVVGKRWEEMKLLAAAAALGQVTGPFQRPPGY